MKRKFLALKLKTLEKYITENEPGTYLIISVKNRNKVFVLFNNEIKLWHINWMRNDTLLIQ